MQFFKNIKQKIKDTAIDLKTAEHAFFIEEKGQKELVLYKKSEAAGDSLIYMNHEYKLTQSQLVLFNDIFNAAVKSRIEIIRFIIETIK